MERVVALAGRRADAADAASPRFPPANCGLVRQRILEQLSALTARALVCSAACGADLVALDAARELGLRRRVVLPFAEARFRNTSVIDRGREWAELFDRTLAELRVTGDVVMLEDAADEAEAYLAANRRILDEAQSLARVTNADVMAVLVWEVRSGGADLDEGFADEARRRGLRIVEISTLA